MHLVVRNESLGNGGEGASVCSEQASHLPTGARALLVERTFERLRFASTFVCVPSVLKRCAERKGFLIRMLS